MKGILCAVLCLALCLSCAVCCGAASESDETELFPVKVSELWGYADSEGRIVIEPQWAEAGEFTAHAAFAALQSDAGQNPGHLFPSDGLIDRNGSYILEPKYIIIEEKDIYYISDSTEQHCGYYDKDSGFYLPPQYERILDGFPYFMKPGKSSLIAAMQNGKWGFIRRETGETALPFIYDDVLATFSCGYALVMIPTDQNTETDPWIWPAVLIDETGKAMQFEDGIRPISGASDNGVFIIGKDVVEWADGKRSSNILYGLANIDGEILIEPKYYSVDWYNAGSELTFCTEPSFASWGVMDQDGNILIEPVYEEEYDALDALHHFSYEFVF